MPTMTIGNPDKLGALQTADRIKKLDCAVSVVIPVYNSEVTLEELVARITATLSVSVNKFEIIFVNDSSRDNSWPVLKDLAERFDNIRAYSLMRNYGQHNAVICGIRHAKYPYTVTIDDDLQNPPEEIPVLLEKLMQGYDVVYGRPMQQEHGLLRNFASAITKMVLQNAMGAETARNISAFRAFRTKTRLAFAQYDGPFANLDVLLTWGTSKFSAVRVKHVPRQIGTTNYTLAKLIAHALNMLTGFSILPLQLASINGFICVIAGLVLLCYVIGRLLLQGCPVQGFPFMASIIIIFSGAQLLALGTIGEYLARVYIRNMRQPIYVIDENTDLDEPADE